MSKAPNITGPRFKSSHKNALSNDFIRSFYKEYPEYRNLTKDQIRSIIKTFNYLITQEVLHTRDGIELPQGLGFLLLGSCPASNKRNIDFKRSADLGYTVLHQNWECDNRLGKIFYSNYKTCYPFRYKEAWGFRAVRQFKREASKEFRNNHTFYKEVLPLTKISKIYKRYTYKNLYKNKIPIVSTDYNEFNI